MEEKTKKTTTTTARRRRRGDPPCGFRMFAQLMESLTPAGASANHHLCFLFFVSSNIHEIFFKHNIFISNTSY
jgi:hypothetical protein